MVSIGHEWIQTYTHREVEHSGAHAQYRHNHRYLPPQGLVDLDPVYLRGVRTLGTSEKDPRGPLSNMPETGEAGGMFAAQPAGVFTVVQAMDGVLFEFCCLGPMGVHCHRVNSQVCAYYWLHSDEANEIAQCQVFLNLLLLLGLWADEKPFLSVSITKKGRHLRDIRCLNFIEKSSQSCP